MTDTTCFSFTLLSFVQACWVPAYTELLYLPGVLHDVPCDQLGMELGRFPSDIRIARRVDTNRESFLEQIFLR